MSNVVVLGTGGALVDSLTSRMSSVLGDCLRVAPDLSGLESLAKPSEGDVWIYVAIAGVGLAGVPDLVAAHGVFEYAERAGVKHLVLVSSAAIHEPSAHHPGFVCEDQRGLRRLDNPIARSWQELETVAGQFDQLPETTFSILRSVPVIRQGGTDFFSRFFSGRLATTLPGFDPSLQLLTPEDLAAAIVRVVRQRAIGVYHVAPRGVIPLREAVSATQTWRLPIPNSLQWLPRKVLSRGGLAAPSAQIDYLRYSSTVSGEKIERELQFEPRYTSHQAVLTVLGSGQSGIGQSSPDNDSLTGPLTDYDRFGMDKQYVARLGKTLFRFMHNVYWRVEWKGLENIPPSGRAVLAGVHRGHQPWDGVMTFYLLARELDRYTRYLIHPTLVKFPFLAPHMIKCGGVHACQENAEWVLENEGLLGIFPEGIRGAFTLYRDAYKLGKFGRDDYVKIALRHQAPIIPYVTVGSAEIFPILGRLDWRWWKRVSEWPFLPITPTMGTVPLPSKWHTWFLEPVSVEGYPPEAANDRAIVRQLSQQVRHRMETAIDDMLRRRKSVFWGTVFNEPEPKVLGEELA